MKKNISVIGLICAALTSNTSLAQPPSQLDEFRGQVGNYTCRGETTGEDAHPFTAKFSLTRELEGGVYVERYVEAKSARHSQPFSIIFLYTYDAENGRYVRNGVDGNGGRHEHTASGWNNGVMTWEAGGFRIPVTRGANQFSFRAELLKDGNWVVLLNAVCKN